MGDIARAFHAAASAWSGTGGRHPTIILDSRRPQREFLVLVLSGPCRRRGGLPPWSPRRGPHLFAALTLIPALPAPTRARSRPPARCARWLPRSSPHARPTRPPCAPQA